MGETTITIELLSPYGSHKRGDIIDLPKNEALDAIKGGIARRTKSLARPPKDRMIHNAMNK